jgi:hypothetical protein
VTRTAAARGCRGVLLLSAAFLSATCDETGSAPEPISSSTPSTARVLPPDEPGDGLPVPGDVGEQIPIENGDSETDAEENTAADSIPIRRVVYRVTFRVPPAFIERKSGPAPPAGELFVDVADERLRARFSGPGWPLEEGTVIHLNRENLGIAVFDSNGRHSLGSGELASWFEGREYGRSRSSLRIRRENVRGRIAGGPGELICALLAEWTAQPRRTVMRRCEGGLLPPGFRFGPWSGELTAVVPMTVPERTLNRGYEAAARKSEPVRNRAYLQTLELARIEPSISARKPSQPREERTSFVNHTSTRIIVIVEGVPVAWVDAGSRGDYQGFRPGRYRVGALRPLGGLRLAPRLFDLPGTAVFGRPRQPPPPLHPDRE